MSSHKAKALKKVVGERILPGHKKKKTEISHERDGRGVVVSYKPTNYLRKK